MGRNQYWAGRVYDLCVYYMTGTPEGSTESGFMEKPGIEPATPGLQGIALIHYTTGASSWCHILAFRRIITYTDLIYSNVSSILRHSGVILLPFTSYNSIMVSYLDVEPLA